MGQEKKSCDPPGIRFFRKPLCSVTLLLLPRWTSSLESAPLDKSNPAFHLGGPSLVHVLMCCTNGVFIVSEHLLTVFLKPAACLEIFGAPTVTASLGCRNQPRYPLPESYMSKSIPSLTFVVPVLLSSSGPIKSPYF